MFVQTLCIAIWQEDLLSNLNPQIRILLPALATFLLLRKLAPSHQMGTLLMNVLAAACIIAFIQTAYLSIAAPEILRNSLASNAIAWAVGMSFIPCILLPVAAKARTTSYRTWFWYLGSLAGVLAVLLSQSRGALLIVPWCLLVLIWFKLPARYAVGMKIWCILLIPAFTTAMILATAWWTPGDKLRLHQMQQDLSSISAQKDYNNSIGARVYLWQMAWNDIKTSPWLGIGGTERLRRIKDAGTNEPQEVFNKLAEVRSLGHAHNQYLHIMWDYGLLGLSAFLVLLGGMIMMVWRLSQIAPTAAWQLAGVVSMHTVAGLTNVNFAHNYYVVALSLAIITPLLLAQYTSQE